MNLFIYWIIKYKGSRLWFSLSDDLKTIASEIKVVPNNKLTNFISLICISSGGYYHCETSFYLATVSYYILHG